MKNRIQKELKKIFTGLYKLERQIDDLLLEGYASFSPISENFIYYYEKCTSLSSIFYQKRYFIFEDKNLSIMTYDKILLHQIALIDLKPPSYSFSHLHLCKDDRYLLDFCIKNQEINMKYQVLGPYKNCSIETYLKPYNL